MAKKKDPAAVALGRKGGKKRAKNLTAEELSEQGRRAVQARWAKKPAKKSAVPVDKKQPAKSRGK